MATALEDALDGGIPGAQITLTGHTTFQNKAVSVADRRRRQRQLHVYQRTARQLQPDLFNLVDSSAAATLSGIVTLGVSISGVSIAGGPDSHASTSALAGSSRNSSRCGSSCPAAGTAISRSTPAAVARAPLVRASNSAPVVKTAISNFSVGLNQRRAPWLTWRAISAIPTSPTAR